MHKVILNQIYTNMISTLLALVMILIVYFFVDFFVANKIDNHPQKRRFRIRALYISCVILLFLMARIWVEGFTHLLAVLGLVSASLVITNKETIMNLVGWLIITWRELFAEDDLIQILQYKGYVKSFGILYFKLFEVSDGAMENITGRIIRVPNGLLATNVLINYSQTSHLLEQKMSVIFSKNSNIEEAIQLLNETISNILANFYKEKKEFSAAYLKKRNKKLAKHINLNVIVTMQPKLASPSGLELIAHYYCFSQDIENVQQRIWMALLTVIKERDDLDIAYEN